MGAFQKDHNHSKNKKRLSKNKTIKLYKEKQSKIQLFQQEVLALKQKYNEFDSQKVQKFDDFPLTEKTRKGLKKAGYIIPTDIQKDSIGLALKGHDILGAAKTGSGKTLAFVIPMLESLYCAGWNIMDGLGALVITPTRELAYQIFEVLNKVGTFHSFSAALVIGGKDLAKELKGLNKCNILICTPGRLLQHMDENVLFDTTSLRMLILDEADRILDMGFEKTVNAILENLPTERQTLLFSATQTKSVKDLARLSLKNPMYVSVHEHAKYSTPESLTQNYMVCDAHSKMNLLWSFIKSHKQQKILVFVSTCKQVKFLQESIIRLKPRVEIMALHGRLHQLRRMQIYDEFCRKNYVVLLATDVAARGLDFPNVNWVVQLDCPEDTNTYIHRAGRTARYQKNGQSLLVLLPSEKPMIEKLKQRKIPIEEQIVDPRKMYDVQRKLEAILARDVNLKNSAQRAFKSYIKNITLMKDKTIFGTYKVDFKKYARSLGLLTNPRLRFLEKCNIVSNAQQNSFVNHGLGSESDDDDDDLLKPKGAPELPSFVDTELDELKESKKLLTKAAIAKRILKKKIKANTVMKFDDEGNPIREVCGTAVPVVAAEIQNQILEEGYSIEKAKLMKEKEEVVDKIIFRERVKQKHREERLKMRSKRKEELGTPQVVNIDNDKEDDDSESEIDPNEMLLQNNDEEEDSESYDDSQEQSNSSEAEKSDNESEVELEMSKKRKKASSHRDVKRHKKNLSSISNFGYSLDDEEDLALQLLTNT